MTSSWPANRSTKFTSAHIDVVRRRTRRRRANETDLDASLTRLRRSVDDFERAREPPQPHFAYGELSKPDYALAHAMHLANHFSVIDA